MQSNENSKKIPSDSILFNGDMPKKKKSKSVQIDDDDVLFGKTDHFTYSFKFNFFKEKLKELRDSEFKSRSLNKLDGLFNLNS